MPTFDDVRRICLALPEVEEHLAWGADVTFRVNEKMFAIGGDGADAVSIKASLEAQADLIALDAGTFSKSAYVGRFGWTTVRLAGVAEPHLRELLESAWRQTAPKRLTRAPAATAAAADREARP
jgi:hypothetical protein